MGSPQRDRPVRGGPRYPCAEKKEDYINQFVHAGTHDKRLENLDQCLTGVAKKWYRTETKFVGDFTNWNAFEAKFANRFGIELTPDARGTRAETLYIRAGELCRNFIDRCRSYQYEVSQQIKQTIARALPQMEMGGG